MDNGRGKTIVRETITVGEDAICSTDAAVTFAHLVELSRNVVKSHLSDLYHDAHFLEEFIGKQEVQLRWACGETGTYISTEDASRHVEERPNAYRIFLRKQETKTILTIWEV
jgi:hypothetical protein